MKLLFWFAIASSVSYSLWRAWHGVDVVYSVLICLRFLETQKKVHDIRGFYRDAVRLSEQVKDGERPNHLWIRLLFSSFGKTI